ncbi:GTPase Era [Mycoplasmopsis anatis]|uniref:GTPase Era n=1 Tax=Mycoplasmopsis anatis TaxID=171279 RepID=UPI001C4E260D|nr:GTPase Era [Mycoplasmopsis anatis]MBW0594812.1 GTPase Era [Mycoplasmopsis anatis]MBW0595422.1 GTPase Era [Mycoplasmopsis anatis]MBW0595845.1 GTPase Era [Mycoplasmopsis anatis]MBW0597236.1 GTPase Era [Mycoplasmopsis anatis]MBW0598412.1 GTPase Era [Mycoplasmopsis anatis]
MEQIKKKVCFVSIVGRPNVGKSSLMNKILSYDLSIVTDTPQTTRDQITGVLTDDETQIIFIDTPGIHKPENKLGEHLNKNAFDTIPEVDVLLFLSPADELIGKGDLLILDKIKDIKNKIAVISKIDKIKGQPERLTSKIEELNKFNFTDIISCSVNDPKSVDDVINTIKKYAYEDVVYYDDDFITDKSMRFIAQEIIREAAINNLYEELPHSIAVEITEFNEYTTPIEIDANIYVKKDSQKGMVIGAGASKIKQIGTIAREKLKHVMGEPVVLRLKVKVSKKWVDNEKELKRFGY